MLEHPDQFQDLADAFKVQTKDDDDDNEDANGNDGNDETQKNKRESA